MLQGFQMWGKLGIKDKTWMITTVSHTLNPGTGMKRRGPFLSGSLKTGMPLWWGSLWSILHVRADFLDCTPIILGFLCTSQEWKCWTSHISYSEELRRWPPLYRESHTLSRWVVSITIPWLRWLCYIISTSSTSPGIHLLPMTSSMVLRFLHGASRSRKACQQCQSKEK